jgi:FKBP-type peptidyl-prolyl cis-trans isomerase SlyD
MEKNKMVSVTYELRLGDKNGEVVEVSDKDHPLTFPYGTGMLLPAFENALADKEIGDSFEIGILAEEGYGQVINDMVVNLPKTVFLIDGKYDYNILKVDSSLQMMSVDGNVMVGKIVSFDDNEVIMDFNHPLAGKDLYFIGEVIDIRDATEEELASPHIEEHCDGECGDNCECNDE